MKNGCITFTLIKNYREMKLGGYKFVKAVKHDNQDFLMFHHEEFQKKKFIGYKNDRFYISDSINDSLDLADFGYVYLSRF